jgi:hypothetical protein
MKRTSKEEGNDLDGPTMAVSKSSLDLHDIASGFFPEGGGTRKRERGGGVWLPSVGWAAFQGHVEKREESKTSKPQARGKASWVLS